MGDQVTGEYGMTVGTPQIASAGPIAFGPDDVLFLADNRSATIFAIQVADDGPTAAADAFDLDDLDTKLCAFLGCDADDLILRDLAVHPRTHNVYVSLIRGRGNAGIPVVLRIDHRDGSISEVPLRDVAFSQIALDNAPADDDPRQDFQLAEPDGTEVEIQELDVQGRTIRIAKKPLRGVDRDRPRLRRRHAARRGHVERGVRVEPAPDPVPVRRRGRRQQPRGLPRVARKVGDARADPHLRPLRGRPRASWPATRAPRSCTSRSPTSRRGRT